VQSYPPLLQVKSVHNIPVEILWHWFTSGSLKQAIQCGLEDGIYLPNDPLHVWVLNYLLYYYLVACKPVCALFNWVWPLIVQDALDVFTECWNNHRVHLQAKPNASGCTPWHAYTVPELMGGQDCLIPVLQAAINALCAEIEVTRKEVFRWVDEEFRVSGRGLCEYWEASMHDCKWVEPIWKDVAGDAAFVRGNCVISCITHSVVVLFMCQNCQFKMPFTRPCPKWDHRASLWVMQDTLFSLPIA